MKKEPAAPLLKIGELASATSTNVSTIKFYIKEGLIQAACKTGPNMAYYHPDSVARVQLIKSLQKEHYYPLSVIKRMLEQSNPAQSPLDIELLDAIHKVDPAGGSQTFTLQEASRMSRLTRDQIRQLARGRVICPETVGRRQIYAEADLQVMLLIRRRLDAGIPFEESVASFITYQEALRPAASADVDAFISRALMAVRPSAKESVRMICVSDETLDAFIGLKRKEFNREFGSDRVNDLYRYSAGLAAALQEIGLALEKLGFAELARRCGDAFSACPQGDEPCSAALRNYWMMINGLTGNLASCVAISSQVHSYFISLKPEEQQGPEALLLYSLRLCWLSLAPSLLNCGEEAERAAENFSAFAADRIVFGIHGLFGAGRSCHYALRRNVVMNLHAIVTRQHEYYNSGATRSLSFRMEALRKLQRAIQENENLINQAMKADLNKSPFESYMTETGMVLDEIRFHLKHLPGWIKTRTVGTPLTQFHAESFVAPEPYGVALVMSPWNYPVQLCLEPVVGAISGGNCVVVKPSAYAPATSHAIAQILGRTFPAEYIAVVEGGREQNQALLDEAFDYIFFTGSVAVGKQVMAAASKNLTPVTLELGGKSPVIVDQTANIKLAARRIAFGKVLNAGQTCVEPDYLLIHQSVKEAFLKEYAVALKEFFPDGDLSNYPHIISDKHFSRLVGLLKDERAVIGGGFDASTRYVEPTVLTDITPASPIMQEEIFGPILPLMTFEKLEECIQLIRSLPRPLALYLFTEDKAAERRILDTCSFGGGCINDTIIHLANPRMGFGGVGYSGMGSYHGKLSFDTFTHYRSVVKKSTWIDLPLRYHPYRESSLRIIRMLMK